MKFLFHKVSGSVSISVILSALILAGCSPVGVEGRSAAEFLSRNGDGQTTEGWQVACIIEQDTATHSCFAGKHGAALSGTRKIPFAIVYRQVVAGGGFLGPTVEPGFHASQDETPLVRIDENAPISDMSSEQLISQILEGTQATAQFQSWSGEKTGLTLDLAGVADAYESLQAEVEAIARLYGRPADFARVVSNDDIERGAKDLIDQYGGEASQEAEQRAQKMAQAGNLKGERVWRQIIDKLNELTGLPAESFEADI